MFNDLLISEYTSYFLTLYITLFHWTLTSSLSLVFGLFDLSVRRPDLPLTKTSSDRRSFVPLRLLVSSGIRTSSMLWSFSTPRPSVLPSTTLLCHLRTHSLYLTSQSRYDINSHRYDSEGNLDLSDPFTESVVKSWK